MPLGITTEFTFSFCVCELHHQWVRTKQPSTGIKHYYWEEDVLNIRSQGSIPRDQLECSFFAGKLHVSGWLSLLQQHLVLHGIVSNN